jgi:hypothetical protein
MRKFATLAAVGVYLLAGAGTLNGGQPLTMQVSPAMAPAPAFISVRAHVEANDENRYLEIVAQSPDFYRSSRISLDGDRAPRLSVFQFPGLPEGLYEVSGTLVGTGGRRGTVTRLVKVVWSLGSGR